LAIKGLYKYIHSHLLV